MNPEAQQTSDVHIVMACLQDQRPTVNETLPSLMSAAVYADKLTVVAFEADTLIELPDFHPIVNEFAEFFDYIGADSYGDVWSDNGDQFYGDDFQMDEDDLLLDRLWLNLSARKLQSERDAEKRAFLEQGIKERKGRVEAADLAREQMASESMADGVLRIVEELLAKPNTFPFVFDPDGILAEDSSELVRLSRQSKRRAEADARLGAGLVDKLPSFDQLSAQEITVVRAELRDLLIPFRGSVSETAVALHEVGRDEEAIADVVHEVYVGKVRPVLNELNEMIARSSFFHTLLREFGRDPKGFLTSFVTFGLGSAVHLPTYATISAAASTELLRVKHEALAQRREASANCLYYLHELGRYIDQSSR